MMRLLSTIAIALGLTVSSVFAGESRVTVLDLQNLQCYGCVMTVKRALQKTSGVEEVEVDLEKKTATVKFDRTKTDPEKLRKATADAGFPSSVQK
jgi:mercuric ion binding protein